MRWLGAFSLARLVSATMRTPLACRLSVMISPWKSLPTFLKEPMVAMSLLLLCFEPATTAASMAIAEAEDDRRRTRLSGRSEAEDAVVATFLPRARNGRSPGEESRKRRRCVSDDRGAAGLRSDQAITEARCVAC